MEDLLKRAWIMLETAVWAASGKSMIILVDLSGQSMGYFSEAVTREDSGLMRPEAKDFFQRPGCLESVRRQSHSG